MKTALTIAGSDPSGGAGIQADIKTMSACGIYAMSVLTALTVQNTVGVQKISEVRAELIGRQLDCIFTDIRPDAVKIGMVCSPQAAWLISEKLQFYHASNIVVDPVMLSTSGSRLQKAGTLKKMKLGFFRQADLLTPNIPEAEVLSGIRIENDKDRMAAAEKIGEAFGCAVLCKGGHSVKGADDLLYRSGKFRWFYGEKVDNPNTHGTGCTLSSAIACGLASGMEMEDAIASAKEYLKGALECMLDLGHGNGPLNHAWRQKSDEK